VNDVVTDRVARQALRVAENVDPSGQRKGSGGSENVWTGEEQRLCAQVVRVQYVGAEVIGDGVMMC